jgi:hypothetical protein
MSNLSLHVVPVLPAWAVLLLSVALLAVLAHGSATLLRRQVPPRWVGILAVLRVMIVALFALVLLQPVLSYTRTAERRPEMLVLLDTSESMAQPGRVEGATRLQEVVRALDEGGLAAELGRRFDLRWFAFDRGAAPLESAEWKTLSPSGVDTYYADSLTQAWSYPRPSASGVAPAGATAERVLLVSDGRDRGRADVVEAARRLGVAIDVIAPGSPEAERPPAPVTVADVQGARRVLLGSETHFLVTVRSERAVADRKVTVRMSEGGKELEAAEVVLRAGRTEERVRLAHRPAETGPRRYEFRADESPVFPLSVQVIDGKHEVLVLDDTWRWEFKFLRRVLEEDPSFRFTALLARGGGAYMQFAAPDRRAQLVGFPQNQAHLAAFDTVIVGDVNPRRWPRDLAPALRRVVAEEGKSLVVLAGPNLAHWVEAPDLLALLPVEISRETANPVAGPVPVRPSAEGARSPFLLQPGAGQAAAVLPAFDQIYPPLRKKPAATVLLEAARLGNAFGPVIVMAEHTVGRGRVLYVGTDTLWKWQTLTTAEDANTTPYHRFWQQALRALAPLRPGGGAVNMWLQPRRSRCEAGQRTTVRAEIDSPAPLAQASVQGAVSLPDGRTLPLSFAPDPASPNAYVAEFETGPAGAYRLTASVASEGRLAAEGAAVLDVDEPRPERDGAPVDVANLTRITAATGGRVIDPADPQTWPASAAAGPAPVTERQTVDWWNRSYLLIVLAVVAGIDWLLRLLRGYV